MDIMLAYLLIAVGAIVAVAVAVTWVVIYQAATEAREYFQRQNAAGRVEDREADALVGDWGSAR